MIAETDSIEFPFILVLGSKRHWYVVQCKSGKEKSTLEVLKASLGLTIYLPEKKIWHKGNPRYIPLFPGYFFVLADLLQTAPSQINTSPGVLRLLGYGGSPQKIPSCFVEALYIEITRLNEYSRTPDQDFRPGDVLYMVNGPLRGLEAVFVAHVAPRKRVQVLLNFLGRLTKTVVEVKDVEECTQENRFMQTRTTRGKGRKIRTREKR